MSKNDKKQAQPWTAFKGHEGLAYRAYGNQKSFRFRMRVGGKEVVDFFGVMSDEKAILIAAQLRQNRATGTGPQSFKEMEQREVSQVQAEHEAQAAEAIVQREERRRILADEQFSQANTVGSFWDRDYWPQRSQSGSEHSNKSLVFLFDKWIRPVVGNIPLAALKYTDIDVIIKKMSDAGLSAKSIKHAYITLQACWNYAVTYLSVHHGVILPVYPGKALKLPKPNSAKTCYLTQDEAALLLDTLYNWHTCCLKHGVLPRATRDTKDAYGMAVLSLLSGLRLGDIAKMRWRDVEKAYAHARTPKGGRAYGIHLDIPRIAEMLAERRAMFPNAKPDDYVFTDWAGKPFKQAPAAFVDAIDELGFNFVPHRRGEPLEQIDFHALRHTFASWLAMRGVSLQTIMVLMGHESIQMTLRYARLNPSYTRQAVAEMATDFAKKSLSDGNFAYIEKRQNSDHVFRSGRI
jgi:integrase